MIWFFLGIGVWLVIALIQKTRPKGAYAKLSKRDLAEHRRMAHDMEAASVAQLQQQAEAMRRARLQPTAAPYDPGAEQRYTDRLTRAARRSAPDDAAAMLERAADRASDPRLR